MNYWDTSCVLKLYAEESDSAAWQELAVGSADPILSSALLSAEIGLALLRKEAMGHLRDGGARGLREQFERDVQAGRIQLLPIGTDVLVRSVELAERCLRGRRPVQLRTLDAIHLATAEILRSTSLATADERMQQAARRMGMKLMHAGPCSPGRARPGRR